MTAPTETELKLECDLRTLKALQSHPLLKDAKKRRMTRLKSVYFDAADRRLRDAGLTLRVRTARRRHVQTIKATGDGLIARPEWERPVAAERPDAASVADTPAGALLSAEDALDAVFTVLVERRIYLARHGGSEIEVAFDEGRITTDGADPHALSEVELELKSGSVADLFALACAFGEAAPLRLGVLSKSERGFMLADGAPVAAAKAGPLVLDKAVTAADAFRTIAHHSLRQIGRNEAVLLERRDVEAVHQMRVGVRRLRSAISLFGPLVKDGVAEELVARLKRVSEPFGRARNLDVFLAETLPLERERRPDEAGLLNLEQQLETERVEAHEVIGAALRSAEWRGLVIDLAAWINAGAWLAPFDEKAAKRLGRPARDFAAKALDKRRRQVKTRGKNLETLTPEARHEVRIAAKKLRYGAQFFAGLYASEKRTERRRTFVKSLKVLQGRLGALNDIATGQQLVATAASSSLEGRSSLYAAGMTAGDLDRGAGDLLTEARAAYDALVALKPFWR